MVKRTGRGLVPRPAAAVRAPDPPLPPLAELIWVTRDKRRYRLREMEVRHIRNCIAMILRNPGWREHYLEPLRAELALRERAIR